MRVLDFIPERQVPASMRPPEFTGGNSKWRALLAAFRKALQ